MMRSKRFGGMRRSSVGRPSRTWVGIDGQFAMAGVTATTANTLVQLQAPADLSNLTSDPPEDMTVLRIRGSFACTISTTGDWVLAMTVQDTTWTPGATFTVDSDKRIIWSRSFSALGAVIHAWNPPGWLSWDTAGTRVLAGQVGMTDVDVSPNVKIGCGQALFLVAYEEGGASTLTVASYEMRMLFQRSGRPR